MKDNWYVLFALVAKENKLCSVLRRKGLGLFQRLNTIVEILKEIH